MRNRTLMGDNECLVIPGKKRKKTKRRCTQTRDESDVSCGHKNTGHRRGSCGKSGSGEEGSWKSKQKETVLYHRRADLIRARKKKRRSAENPCVLSDRFAGFARFSVASERSAGNKTFGETRVISQLERRHFGKKKKKKKKRNGSFNVSSKVSERNHCCYNTNESPYKQQ